MCPHSCLYRKLDVCCIFNSLDAMESSLVWAARCSSIYRSPPSSARLKYLFTNSEERKPTIYLNGGDCRAEVRPQSQGGNIKPLTQTKSAKLKNVVTTSVDEKLTCGDYCVSYKTRCTLVWGFNFKVRPAQPWQRAVSFVTQSSTQIAAPGRWHLFSALFKSCSLNWVDG
mgnify:CR=1 FL=1